MIVDQLVLLGGALRSDSKTHKDEQLLAEHRQGVPQSGCKLSKLETNKIMQQQLQHV